MMSNSKSILWLLLFSLVLGACKKEEKKDDGGVTDPPLSQYYIQGKVDGEVVFADYICQYNGCDVVTGNYNADMAHVKMERDVSSSDNRKWFISIRDIDLDDIQLPLTIDATGLIGSPHVALSFYVGDVSPENNYMTDAVELGDDSFELVITGFSNDVLEGTFQGSLRNGRYSNDQKTVTEGQFRIKLIRI